MPLNCAQAATLVVLTTPPKHNFLHEGGGSEDARSSGPHEHDGVKYRFMVMDTTGEGLLKVLDRQGKKICLETPLGLGILVIDVSEDAHSGQQKEYKEELTNAHNNTIQFRRQATHVGEQSQRCSMELLNETLVQWLFCRLPWEYNLKYPECVTHQESPVLEDTPLMLSKNFPHQDIPCGITNFLKYVASIKLENAPDYKRLKRI
ncbi:serine/threonine-protein kinase VRK1-like [Rhipicephalus microplus]|uniref:serine/threonine-protein kinase VRK1-like n=1 Tax=Rhipicephalus microplus TaxID=6941 RepID=UPI003F6CC628